MNFPFDRSTRIVARKFSTGGLGIIKLTKTPLIYSVSCFNFEGFGALYGGSKPTKSPRSDGTVFNKTSSAMFASSAFMLVCI